jgi:hypothetical protein
MLSEGRLPEELELYWNGRLLGKVVEVAWSDFPWASGKLIRSEVSPALDEVLHWFAHLADADELEDPPFRQDLLKNWWLQTSGGKRYEISVPIVDFQSGMIEWR